MFDYFKKFSRNKQTQGFPQRTSDATRISDVLTTNKSRHYQSSFFVKSFFQNLGGFIAPLNRKKTTDYYLSNNNCYNKTSVRIIRTVIFESPCDRRLILRQNLLFAKSSKVHNLKYVKGVPLKMYEVL